MIKEKKWGGITQRLKGWRDDLSQCGWINGAYGRVEVVRLDSSIIEGKGVQCFCYYTLSIYLSWWYVTLTNIFNKIVSKDQTTKHPLIIII